MDKAAALEFQKEKQQTENRCNVWTLTLKTSALNKAKKTPFNLRGALTEDLYLSQGSLEALGTKPTVAVAHRSPGSPAASCKPLNLLLLQTARRSAMALMWPCKERGRVWTSQGNRSLHRFTGNSSLSWNPFNLVSLLRWIYAQCRRYKTDWNSIQYIRISAGTFPFSSKIATNYTGV